MSEFGGSIPFPNGQSNTYPYASVGSFQSVVDAPNGEVFWQDRLNNKVWFKVRGGIREEDTSLPTTNDYNLYRSFRVRAYGQLSPLPITLTSFTGQQKSNQNHLVWTTNTEVNANFFVIERSLNGIDFNEIGQVKAMNSARGSVYNFDDNNPSESLYYRLRMVDFDNNFKFSNTITVVRSDAEDFVIDKIYPNPLKGIVNIDFRSRQRQNITFEIIDILGRRLSSNEIIAPSDNNSFEIDLSALSSGVYFLNIKNESNINVTHRILKE